MAWPDVVNGTFEVLGGLFVLNHCRAVRRDKAVAGVSITSTACFTIWGFWNLFFYGNLNEPVSFAGSIVVTAANVLYVALLVHYRKKSVRAGNTIGVEAAAPRRWRASRL